MAGGRICLIFTQNQGSGSINQ